MSAVVVPMECATALKEWATVLEAMARGEQTVLIRKGGLIEPGRGFALAANTFLLYPTFEHQAVNYLRPSYRGYFEEAVGLRPSEGHVRMNLFGVAVSSAEVRDPSIVERLSAFHIYNQEFVSQRLKWQPEQPLVIVVVRAFHLVSPVILPVVPRYAGCTSWVALDSPIRLEGAQPALDEAVFHQRARDITALLSSS